MPSSMGSIVVTDWVQQQIWGELGDINQLQMHTQHNLTKIDRELERQIGNLLDHATYIC